MSDQFTTARQEVGVDVCLGDARDAKPICVCGGDVGVGIAVGIDDQRLSRLLTAHQVARLGKSFVIESLK